MCIYVYKIRDGLAARVRIAARTTLAPSCRLPARDPSPRAALLRAGPRPPGNGSKPQGPTQFDVGVFQNAWIEGPVTPGALHPGGKGFLNVLLHRGGRPAVYLAQVVSGDALDMTYLGQPVVGGRMKVRARSKGVSRPSAPRRRRPGVGRTRPSSGRPKGRRPPWRRPCRRRGRPARYGHPRLHSQGPLLRCNARHTLNRNGGRCQPGPR